MKNINEKNEYIGTILLIIILIIFMVSTFFDNMHHKSQSKIWDSQINFDANIVKSLKYLYETIEDLQTDVFALEYKVNLLESKLNESVNT